jgi:hypothetical protein
MNHAILIFTFPIKWLIYRYLDKNASPANSEYHFNPNNPEGLGGIINIPGYEKFLD